MLDLQGYEASILKGALVTIEVAVLSLILAVVLGMLGAWQSLLLTSGREQSRRYTPPSFAVSQIWF